MAINRYHAEAGRWHSLGPDADVIPPAPPSPGPPPPPPHPGGSGMLLGASRSSGTAAWATTEAAAGPYGIARSFNSGGFESSWAASIGGPDVGVCASWCSWKPDLHQMASGALDAAVIRLVSGIPDGHPAILSIWHEPDVKTRHGQVTSSGVMTPALFLPGFIRFCQLVKSVGKPHVYTSLILANYTLITPGLTSGLADDFWPANNLVNIGTETVDMRDVVDLAGFDTYRLSNTSLGGAHQLGPCVAWSAARNVDYSIPELGLAAEATDQTLANAWLADVLAYAAANSSGKHTGCAAASYFDAGTPKYPSGQPSYIAASKAQAELYYTPYPSWKL